MKRIQGESFEVWLEDGNPIVHFKGALRLNGSEDYAPILEMLRGTLEDLTTPIGLDVRELEFLNSSGITMFSRFVMEARVHEGIDLKILASDDIPWHARSLKNLQRLMPALAVFLG